MTALKVHDWDEHQTYRSDRGRPPWIKLHRNIFQSVKWAALSDSEKGQLVSLWILAADKDGQIPGDAHVLQKLCLLDSPPNLSKFMDLGLLTPSGSQDDANVTSHGSQRDVPEAEEEKRKRREEKKEQEQRAGRAPRKTGLKTEIPDLSLPDEWRDYCQTKRPDLTPDEVWENFSDYYLAHGKTMKDWSRCWQRWVRNERKVLGRVPPESDAEGLRTLAEQHGIDWKRSNSYFDLRRAISQATGMPL